MVFVSSGLNRPAGDVLLVLAAGSRLSAYIGATVGEIGFLRSIWMDGSRRLAWLEDYAASLVASADLAVPSRLTGGIRFEHTAKFRASIFDADNDLSCVGMIFSQFDGQIVLLHLLLRQQIDRMGQLDLDLEAILRARFES